MLLSPIWIGLLHGVREDKPAVTRYLHYAWTVYATIFLIPLLILYGKSLDDQLSAGRTASDIPELVALVAGLGATGVGYVLYLFGGCDDDVTEGDQTSAPLTLIACVCRFATGVGLLVSGGLVNDLFAQLCTTGCLITNSALAVNILLLAFHVFFPQIHVGWLALQGQLRFGRDMVPALIVLLFQCLYNTATIYFYRDVVNNVSAFDTEVVVFFAFAIADCAAAALVFIFGMIDSCRQDDGGYGGGYEMD